MVTYKFSADKTISGKREYQFSPYLNVEHLNKLYENDIERAIEMFEMYLEILPSSLVELKALCNEESYEELAAIFHNMNSFFGLVGLSNLETAAKSLERKSRDFANGTSANYQLLVNAITMFISICERANLQIEQEIKQIKSFLAN